MNLAATVRRDTRHVPDLAAALALFEPLAHQPREMLAFAYLDPERRVLGMRHTHPGGTAAVLVPVRDVVADAIAFDTVAVVMAHNHPSGDPTPSEADRAVTRRLAQALNAIGVSLVDHVILARDRSASFRMLELL
jgi:DNA repair protein RadC